MKKLGLSSKQAGFTVVEGLLILVIVALVAGVGYYVYSQSQKQDETSQPQSSVSESARKEHDVKMEEKSMKKYLKVEQFGVKLELTGNTHDAYYVIKNGYVYVSTKSLDKYGCEASESKNGGLGLAALSKAKLGDTNTELGTPLTEENMKNYDATKIGDYYYWMTGNQHDCTTGKAPELYATTRHDLASATVVSL